VFERGGRKKGEIGNPNREEDPGKPDDKQSERGFGTGLRTDPVFLGLQKTRLLDPIMSLPGTNDHPGDYRGSGCTACHVIYANDCDPAHSAAYAPFGHSGFSASSDPTIPKKESGHPIKHAFTRSIPSSQCMICHIHPGSNMVTTYFGLTWWDNEIDGDKMYPKEQRNPTEERRYQAFESNPEGAAVRGLWSDEKFLEKVGSPEFNKELKTTQFADFHGHGWVFRAVFNHDRKGNWLDKDGKQIAFDDPDRFGRAVHLADIHLEKGMQCGDCHFAQDNHGNGNIYGEPRAAVEIDCIDCHGTIRKKATLIASGLAAPAGGRHLDALRTPWGLRRFESRDGKVFQRSMSDEDKEWEIVQTIDSITPGNEHFSEKSLRAKLMNKDGRVSSQMPGDDGSLAHGKTSMTCYSCHTSWTPTCFGCHLQMTANARKPMLHNEGLVTKNYTSYNFQVLRDDIYMLGVDGTVTGHRIAPARSSCAVLVSSQNANRDWLYYAQQTISAPGFSGQAFSTFVPHTVRAKETKQCSDCHVSANNDNNAWMAQLLLQGTNFMNFMGRYVYVATGNKGSETIAVAEHDEPEAIYGSDLQRIAYPDNYRKFVERNRELSAASEHSGNVLDIQARGEYAYAALGSGGLRVYDIANIDNKNFSDKVTTAPVSPLGQRFYVATKNALAVASPTTLGVDPLRRQLPENEEQPIHLLYGFLYVADKEEGLVIVGDPNLKSKSPGVGTLLDGNPANNLVCNNTHVYADHSPVSRPVRIYNRYPGECPPVQDGGGTLLRPHRVFLGWGVLGAVAALLLEHRIPYDMPYATRILALIAAGYVALSIVGLFAESIYAWIKRRSNSARASNPRTDRIDCHLVNITVDSYVFNDKTGKDFDPKVAFQGQAAGWGATVDPPSFVFLPGEAFRDVELRVDAPDIAGPPGHVNVWQGGVPSGGVTVEITTGGN
jgi:hypothetical protein